MTIEKSFPSGMWIVTDIIKGQYIKRRYMGYTKREAMAMFRQEAKQATS